MKKILSILTLLLIPLVLFACQSVNSDTSAKQDVIKIGAFGSDYDIWSHIASLDLLEENDLELDVIDMSGQGNMNEAVANGDLDANAFQSLAYLEAYNEDAPTSLSPVIFTYMEPMGIYSNFYESTDDIPAESEITLPSDPSEQSRALILLETAGLIKLDSQVDGLYVIDDVLENPKQLILTEIQDASVPRTLEDAAAGVIGNTVAMDAGFSLREDAIFIEEVSEENIGNYNVVVTREELADDPRFKKLNDLYHHPQVQDYIEEEYQGTKVEITKSIDEIVKKDKGE